MPGLEGGGQDLKNARREGQPGLDALGPPSTAEENFLITVGPEGVV